MDLKKEGFSKYHKKEEELIKAIFFTSKQLRSFIAKNLKIFDIAFEQAGILFLLKEKEELGVNAIANAFEKDKATISRAIKVLEAKKLIQKFQEIEDKRNCKIKLSKQGYEKIKQIEEKHLVFMAKIENAITPEERKIFLNTLQKFLEAIE